MNNSITPEIFDRIYTRSYIHGENEDLSKAYVKAIDNTPRYNDSTSDYRTYLTKSMNSRSTIDKSLFSLDFLYKNKIDLILTSEFKLNFLYDYNRSIEGIYPDLEAVRLNNSIGIFDLSTCFYTTGYTKKLPFTSTFDTELIRNYFDDDKNFSDSEHYLNDIVDIDKFKSIKSYSKKIEYNNYVNVDDEEIKISTDMNIEFSYKISDKYSETAVGTVYTFSKGDNTFISYYYDSDCTFNLIKINNSDNIKFIKIEYISDYKEFVALISRNLQNPELYYSDDFCKTWKKFEDIDDNGNPVVYYYKIFNESNKTDIKKIWDYTNVTNMNIAIINKWNFEDISIIAYAERANAEEGQPASVYCRYMYSVDGKNWDKCNIDDDIYNLLLVSASNHNVKIKKIKDKYYMYYSEEATIIDHLIGNDSRNNPDFSVKSLLVSDDGITWETAYNKPDIIYSVEESGDELIALSRKYIRTYIKCDAPEDENHDEYYEDDYYYSVIKLTDINNPVIYEFPPSKNDKYIDTVRYFDGNIVTVNKSDYEKDKYDINTINFDQNTHIKIETVYKYCFTTDKLFYIKENYKKELRYTKDLDSISSYKAKKAEFLTFKPYSEYNFGNFIKLIDTTDKLLLGIELYDSDNENYPPNDRRFNIAWYKYSAPLPEEEILEEENIENVETDKINNIEFTPRLFNAAMDSVSEPALGEELVSNLKNDTTEETITENIEQPQEELPQAVEEPPEQQETVTNPEETQTSEGETTLPQESGEEQTTEEQPSIHQPEVPKEFGEQIGQEETKETETQSEDVSEEEKQDTGNEGETEEEPSPEITHEEQPSDIPEEESPIIFTVNVYGSDKDGRWGAYKKAYISEDVNNPDDKILIVKMASSSSKNTINMILTRFDENTGNILLYHNYYYNNDIPPLSYIDKTKFICIGSEYYVSDNRTFIFRFSDNHSISYHFDYFHVILDKDNCIYAEGNKFDVNRKLWNDKRLENFFVYNNKIYTYGKINDSNVYYASIKNHTIKDTHHLSKDYRLVLDKEHDLILFNTEEQDYPAYYCSPDVFMNFIINSHTDITPEQEFPYVYSSTGTLPFDINEYFVSGPIDNSFTYATNNFNLSSDYVSMNYLDWYKIEGSVNNIFSIYNVIRYKDTLITLIDNKLCYLVFDKDTKTSKWEKLLTYFNTGSLIPELRDNKLSDYKVCDIYIEKDEYIAVLFVNKSNSMVLVRIPNLSDNSTWKASEAEYKYYSGIKFKIIDDKRVITYNTEDDQIITTYDKYSYENWLETVKKEYLKYYHFNNLLDKKYNKIIDDFEKDFIDLTSECLTFYEFITKFGITSDRYNASKVVRLYNHIVNMQKFIAFSISSHKIIEDSFKVYDKIFNIKKFEYSKLFKNDFNSVPHIYNILWSITNTRLSKLSKIDQNKEIYNYFSNILIKNNVNFCEMGEHTKFELIDPIYENASNGNRDGISNNMDKVYSVLTENYTIVKNIILNYKPEDDVYLKNDNERFNKKFIKYLYMAVLVLQIFDVITSSSSVNKSLDALSFDTVMQVLKINYNKNYSDNEIFEGVTRELRELI